MWFSEFSLINAPLYLLPVRYMPCVSRYGYTREATVSPVPLHREYQVYSSGLVRESKSIHTQDAFITYMYPYVQIMYIMCIMFLDDSLCMLFLPCSLVQWLKHSGKEYVDCTTCSYMQCMCMWMA